MVTSLFLPSNQQIKTALYSLFLLCWLIFANSQICFAINQPDYKPKDLRELTIITTIAPFYNLIAAVTGDLHKLNLIVPNHASLHGYSLKPSDITTLNKADLIFWGGNNIEPFLSQTIKNLQKQKLIVTFSAAEHPLDLLPIRNTTNWQHTCCDHHTATTDDPIFDPHFWLSLINAEKIVTIIVNNLIKLDPDNAAIYQQNASEFNKKLSLLDQQLQQQFSNVKHLNYLVFHDAYQYLEQAYHLNSIGAITLNPELPTSASRIQVLNQQLTNINQPIKCIFREPQFQPKIIASLAKSTTVDIGVLDPLGEATDLGADGYLKLLTKLANNLTSCLLK